MCFTESSADWFLLCCCGGALGSGEVSPPSLRFGGQRSPFSSEGHFSWSVCAKVSFRGGRTRTPACEAVAHSTLPSGFAKRPRRNRHVVVRTFSQNWVNVRRCNELDENTAELTDWTLKPLACSEASQPTHHSPLFVFVAGCDTQPDPAGYHFAVWVQDHLYIILHWKAICGRMTLW